MIQMHNNEPMRCLSTLKFFCKRSGTLLCIFLFLLVSVSACHYPSPDFTDEELPQQTKDSLTFLAERHYTYNSNFELYSDSILLERLPIKDSYVLLQKGDHVVVAEFAIRADSLDSIWVKLAHSQEMQGWVRERDLIESFVPTDSISHSIYLFSHTYVSYFIIVWALFIILLIIRAFRRKQLQLVYFNDIDSIYPLLLCLLVSFSATIYESMQLFVPETWQHFYFNPTLSPFKVPVILSLFLLSLWVSIVVLIAVIEDSFHQLRPGAAIFYLLGVMASCIFCYFFFIITTHFYIGYAFLAAFFVLFTSRVIKSVKYKYRCGACGTRIKRKGKCPHCGAINH